MVLVVLLRQDGNPGIRDSTNLGTAHKTGGSGNGPAVWSSGSHGHTGAYAYMQSDGNLVVYSSGGGPGIGGTLWSTGTYKRGQSIASGQKLWAGWWTQAQYTRLVMQPDGNLVIYRNRDGKAIWSSATSGHSSAYAYMQSDGNLVVYNNGGGPSSGGALWSTGTWGHSGAYAVMQNDGNFVVYKNGGATTGGALWSTGTYKDVP